MAHNLYDIGDQPTVTARFTNIDGVPADPSAASFSIKAPDGTVTVLAEDAATNPTVGEWRWAVPAAFDAAGIWDFRVEATAGLQTAEETSVIVRASKFGGA